MPRNLLGLNVASGRSFRQAIKYAAFHSASYLKRDASTDLIHRGINSDQESAEDLGMKCTTEGQPQSYFGVSSPSGGQSQMRTTEGTTKHNPQHIRNSEHASFTSKKSCSTIHAHCPVPLQATCPTDAVSSLPTDASDALDVCPGSRGGLILLQLSEEMLCELREDVPTAGQDKMTQGNDGPLTHGQPGARQLRQEAAQDGRMERVESSP